jgi:hypothetical protein
MHSEHFPQPKTGCKLINNGIDIKKSDKITLIGNWKQIKYCLINNCIIFKPFEKLRKATTSFLTSVYLSVWDKSATTARIFMKFDIQEFF